jgi:hypothetical protein
MTSQEQKRLIEEAEFLASQAGCESAIDYAARFQEWHKPRNETTYRIDADAVDDRQLTVLKALALQGAAIAEQNEEGYDEGIPPPLFYRATGKLQQRIAHHKHGEHNQEHSFQENIKKTEPTASQALPFRHFKASDEFKRYLSARQGNERAALIDYAAATEYWREIDDDLYIAKADSSRTTLLETLKNEGIVAPLKAGAELFYRATAPELITQIQAMEPLTREARAIVRNAGNQNEFNR